MCYLFINPLFEVSQCTARAVAKTTEGFGSEQPRSFLHAITIRPIWPCEDAPFCSHGGGGGMRSAGVLPERLFTFSFNINHSYWEMLPHVHKTPQASPWWATLCYLHVFACASPVCCQRASRRAGPKVEVMDTKHVAVRVLLIVLISLLEHFF